MNWLWAAAAVLVLWAGIAALRRRSEYAHGKSSRPQQHTTPPDARGADDEIDYDVLEEAEREVKDLDPRENPEEGLKGDDWGPGAARWL